MWWLLFFIGPVFAQAPKAAPVVNLTLKGPNNETVGTAQLTGLEKGVKITLDIEKLPAGPHAIHFHENGKCDGPKFTSAGGHYNPQTMKHGFDHAEGFHAGDMPNIMVQKNGKARLELVNTSVTLDDGPRSLRKPGGTTLIIHGGVDDYKSQPAGNAGDRIACAVIPPNA